MANGDNGYGNTQLNTDSPSWLERFERAQEIQNSQIGELTKNVSALTATVGTLGSQQKALFGRADRPYPWGALVSAITLLILGASLLVSPIKDDIRELGDTEDTHTKMIIENAHTLGVVEENLRWLNTLEERVNVRMHRQN